MVLLIFPDGSELRAKGATEALKTLGSWQWDPVTATIAVKRAMSERAWVWTETAIDPDQDDDPFLDAMERAGLCVVIRDPDPAKPSLKTEPDGDQ